ncbi:MAG: hypothetical protein R3A12_00755 [Ignavibacteria bacterium]
MSSNNYIKRFRDYLKRKDTLKYKYYKFTQKHSKVTDDSPVIIVWEMGGFGDIMKKNAMIAGALNIRGYKTHFIICDGTPEACIQRGLEKKEELSEWKDKCPKCFSIMKYVAGLYNVDYSVAGDYISEEKKKEFLDLSQSIELDEIFHYKYLGVGCWYASSEFR